LRRPSVVSYERKKEKEKEKGEKCLEKSMRNAR